MLLLQFFQFLAEIAADFSGVGSQVVFFDDIDDGLRGSAGDRIASEGRNRQPLKRIGDLWLRNGQPNGHAISHAFGGSNHVRFHFPVLDSEPFVPGAPPAGLYFIGDEVAAILLHDTESHLEIFFRWRDEAGDALDGLR